MTKNWLILMDFFLNISNRACWFQIWTQNCKIPTRNASNQQFSNWHGKKTRWPPWHQKLQSGNKLQQMFMKTNHIFCIKRPDQQIDDMILSFLVPFLLKLMQKQLKNLDFVSEALWSLCRWLKVVLSRKHVSVFLHHYYFLVARDFFFMFLSNF